MAIIRKHKPKPLKLSESQIQSIHSSSGLGDRFAFFFSPIAKSCNYAGQHLERAGKFLSGVGKHHGGCKCKDRQACLNKLNVSLKHPLSALAQIWKCFRLK